MHKICFVLICIIVDVSTQTEKKPLESITKPCSSCGESPIDDTGPVTFPVAGGTSQGSGKNNEGSGKNSEESDETEESNENHCKTKMKHTHEPDDDKEALIAVILEKKEKVEEKIEEKIEATKEKVKDKIESAKEKVETVKKKLAILTAGASVTASILVIQVAVLPLLFKYSKCVQRKMVFSNCINYPRNLNYESPSSVDIVGGRNFSILFQSEIDKCPIKIGIWHIVPRSLFCRICNIKDAGNLEAKVLRELRSTSDTIVLYCHGNSNHRASPHRLQLYKVFQELNFHVITFDYRGYGDSSQVRPTEQGVVEDCLQVYNWLIQSLDPISRPTILLWGHSLGSAMAANLVAHLPSLCKQHGLAPLPAPDALVLESPFNNLSEEIASHPFSKLVSWLPYYRHTFVMPFLQSPEFSFTTDQYLTRAPSQPALMLHCRGDKIVPYELAVKLYETVKESRGPGSAPLVLHSFEKGHGLGHNNICEAHDLQIVVRNFLDMLNLEKRKANKLVKI